MLGRRCFHKEILLPSLHFPVRWLHNQISRFGPAARNWLFSWGDPFTNLSFPGLAAQDQISRFCPPVCKWLWLFWENLNSKLIGSSVRFQGVCNGLEAFSFFRECISLEMIHCLLASSNCPARKWRVCENFRIWWSIFLSEAAVRCNVYCIKMLLDITKYL